MYYPEEIVEEVRSRNDIVDVIAPYVKLTKRGSSYMGLCPFHGEKTPSFSVSRTRQTYHCFGCGKGGNVYTFLMEYENITFPEALRSLAERAGVRLPQEEESPEAKARSDKRTRLLAMYKEAATYYFYQLTKESGAPAYRYFRGRGLTDETIRKFGLGYSGKSGKELYPYLKEKGYSDELLRESGLVTFDEKRGVYDKFWNRAMFPIMDANGKVIGFGGRVLGDGLPKYLNSPETMIFDKSRTLYGLHVAKQSRKNYMILCEGYMDVIAMHQAGFTMAVASLGTALTERHASLLKRYVDQVVLCYDSDGAGVKAAMRAIPMLRDAGIRTRVLNLEPYKDPDEFIKALGQEAFEKRLEEAENSFYFEIRVLQRDFNLADPEEKTRFFRAVSRKLLIFSDDLERNNYIEALAAKYQIRAADLRRMVNSQGNDAEKVRREQRAAYTQEPVPVGEPVLVKRGPRASKEDGLTGAQKILLTTLAAQPSLIPKLEGKLGPEDFEDPLFCQVARRIYDEYESGGTVMPARIINTFTDKDEQSAAADVLSGDLPESSGHVERERAFNEARRRLMRRRIDNALAAETDFAKIRELAAQKKECENLWIELEMSDYGD